MKKICIDKAIPEDFINIERGDWIEDVGSILTNHEVFLIHNLGKLFLKQGIVLASPLDET